MARQPTAATWVRMDNDTRNALWCLLTREQRLSLLVALRRRRELCNLPELGTPRRRQDEDDADIVQTEGAATGVKGALHNKVKPAKAKEAPPEAASC